MGLSCTRVVTAAARTQFGHVFHLLPVSGVDATCVAATCLSSNDRMGNFYRLTGGVGGFVSVKGGRTPSGVGSPLQPGPIS